MRRSRMGVAGLVFAVVAALAACEESGGINQIQAPPAFSVDAFEDNIRSSFTDEVVGFTYAISRNGSLLRSGEVGFGRTQFEPAGTRLMQHDQRMHIASISKTITTAAVLRLLEDTPGIDLDSPVAPYLPPSWTVHSSINDSPGSLTFRRLLSHRGGFNFPVPSIGTTDAALQTHLAAGIPNPPSTRTYENAHHAFFRVIIPYVLGATPSSSETLANFHSRVFGAYVQQAVFDPAGLVFNGNSDPESNVSGVSGSPTIPPVNSNRYYPWPYNEEQGFDVAGTDFALSYGPFGWYMSSVEVAQFLAFLRYTDDIISASSRQVMDDENLGYWNSRDGDHGEYLLKQGGWFWTNNPVEQGTQSIAGSFAEGVQAVVIVNSRRDGNAPASAPQPLDMATIMQVAFDSAWVSR